jgi:hypothetical protein
MLIASEAFWLGALGILVLGFFVVQVRRRAVLAGQIKNMPVKVVTYRNGRTYKFAFFTIGEAAAYALGRLATGQGVAYIESNGETVWTSLKGKQSLVELAK